MFSLEGWAELCIREADQFRKAGDLETAYEREAEAAMCRRKDRLENGDTDAAAEYEVDAVMACVDLSNARSIATTVSMRAVRR